MSDAAGRKPAGGRMPKWRPCAAPATAARGGTLYVTLEPCSHHGKSPPCADAVIAAGLSRVVSALEDPNPEVAGAGHARLRAAGITVDVGTGADEARRAHAGHILRMTAGRPYVMLKLAISADGKAGARRAQAGCDHRRGRARARASSSGAIRRGRGWHRHGACRRSGADLPPAGNGRSFAGACRVRQHVAPAASIHA